MLRLQSLYWVADMLLFKLYLLCTFDDMLYKLDYIKEVSFLFDARFGDSIDSSD